MQGRFVSMDQVSALITEDIEAEWKAQVADKPPPPPVQPTTARALLAAETLSDCPQSIKNVNEKLVKQTVRNVVADSDAKDEIGALQDAVNRLQYTE